MNAVGKLFVILFLLVFGFVAGSLSWAAIWRSMSYDRDPGNWWITGLVGGALGFWLAHGIFCYLAPAKQPEKENESK